MTYVTSAEHSKEEIFTGNNVSFNEFLVAKFMKTWKPYYKQCLPCTIKYNQIVKLDFAPVDEKLVSMYYTKHPVGSTDQANPSCFMNIDGTTFI